MSKTKLTLIKLGGSIITDKEGVQAVKTEVLTRLVAEIVRAQKQTNEAYVIGHGSGSFAHIPAQKYDTMHGFTEDEGAYGMAVTHHAAAELNRVVVAECLRQGLPAISYLMSNTLTTENRVARTWDSKVLESYLEHGIVPVTYGDVIADTEQGCTIWSTEEVLAHMAQYFLKHGHEVKQIVHVTEVPGVLDRHHQVVPLITQQNQEQIRTLITKTKGTDVTGGMWHKIQESLDLASKAVTSLIIGGTETNNLYNALVGQPFSGTTVQAVAQPATDYQVPIQVALTAPF